VRLPVEHGSGARRAAGRIAGARRTRLVRVVVLLAALALVYLLVHPAGGSPEATSPLPGIKVGEPAPAFALGDQNGKLVRLSELRGRWVLVNFWGVTCPPCAAEMPAMERTYLALSRGHPADEHPAIIGIDGDLDSLGAVKAFARRVGVTYPILLDKDLSVVTRYHIGQIPTSVFLDPNGRIRAIHTGPLQASQIRRGLHGKFPL
jgi:peroxiredoxin